MYWTSSNDKVATVDAKGRIHTLAPGEANITATSEKDKTKKGTTFVTVEGITQVSLQPKSLEIASGEVRTLIADVQGMGKFNSAITWSSSDSQIASVNQIGSVQGIAKGKAVIQAKAKQDPSKTATVQVTVSQKVAIDRIVITTKGSTDDLHVGSVLLLSATVEGLGANSEDVSWTTSNPQVAELINRGRQVQLSAKSSGKVTITVTSNQDKSKRATLQLTILPPTVTEIRLYPNTLELDPNQHTRICATVINLAIEGKAYWK